MAITQTGTTFKKAGNLSAILCDTSGFYRIPFIGGTSVWVSDTGVPAHNANSIGDLCVDLTSGYWYSATDVAGTWEKLNN